MPLYNENLIFIHKILTFDTKKKVNAKKYHKKLAKNNR